MSNSKQVIDGECFEIPEYYKVQNIIGRGSYGVVASALDVRNGEKVAIKKISNIFQKSKDYQKRIVRELKILKHYSQVSHENIVQLRDLVVPRSENELRDLYIITELMDCTVRDVLKSNQNFTDINTKYFLYHMLKGLAYIHSSGIAHRDIKPQNILVNENFRIAYCDFGLSRGVDIDSKISTNDIASLWYRSPEVILGYEYGMKPMDIWGLGCILGEMLNCGRVLFQGSSALDVLDKQLELLGTPDESSMKGSFKAVKYLKSLPPKPKPNLSTVFPNASPDAIDLLLKMLEWDPDRRITAEQALQHPYLTYIREQYGNEEEIVCVSKFDYRFDESMKTETVRAFLYEELKQFVQQYRGQAKSTSNNLDNTSTSSATSPLPPSRTIGCTN